MLHEVDQALLTLLRRDVLNGNGVEAVLEAPTREWSSRRSGPTLNVFLYDVREDLHRRERGLINEIGPDGRVLARVRPPRYFVLSYLVTAWTTRPEDEHRLLAATLSCLVRHDKLPPDVLAYSLAELGLPIPLTIALPPPEDRSFADVWSALGGELKPSLDVRITAPLESGRRYEAGPPVRETTVLRLRDGDPRDEIVGGGSLPGLRPPDSSKP